MSLIALIMLNLVLEYPLWISWFVIIFNIMIPKTSKLENLLCFMFYDTSWVWLEKFVFQKCLSFGLNCLFSLDKRIFMSDSIYVSDSRPILSFVFYCYLDCINELLLKLFSLIFFYYYNEIQKAEKSWMFFEH